MTRALLALCALSLLLPAAAAGAQAESPRDEAPMSPSSVAALDRARRMIAAHDTTGAIAILRTAAAADPENGPLWWEYGALLAAKTRPEWRTAVMPAGVPQMMIAADSAMARAVRLSPDSLHWGIAYGKFLFGSNIFSVSRAEGFQKRAIARLSGTTESRRDSVLLAESADYVGLLQWRRFEPLINMGLPPRGDASDKRRLRRKALVLYLKENHRPPKTMYGLALFNDAREYFRLARRIDPSVEMYYRHELLMLAESSRWLEMELEARTRVARYPEQPWGWLTLGLARHRLGQMAEGQAAFDSGFVRLPAADRERLQSLVNVLPRDREKWYDSLDTGAKRSLSTLFWNSANPSLLLPTNPMLAEFRARVVYSELRFTDEERGTPGANTDKGEIYIRFGPPDVMLPIVVKEDHGPAHGQKPQAWVYYNELMIYTFGQMPGYGTAFQTAGSRVDFDSSAIDRPTAWTNLPVLRNRVDSVNSQVARFRAAGDSMDLAIFSGVRNGALRRKAPIAESTIRYGAFVLNALGEPMQRLTDSATSSERDTIAVTTRSWFLRAPTNASAVRLEALEPDLMQAARSITDVSGFTSAGFGVSDLLVTAEAKPSSGSATRWTDYRFTPLVGSIVERGAPVDLLWETYDAGAAGGRSRLRVAIAVQREIGTGLLAVAGRIVGGVRGAISGSTGANGTAITYDREYEAAPVLVDHLRVDLGRLAPGRYRVSLVVTDLIRGSTVSRLQRFAIDR